MLIFIRAIGHQLVAATLRPRWRPQDGQRKLGEAGYRDLITTVRDKGYRVSAHAVAMRRSIGDGSV